MKMEILLAGLLFLLGLGLTIKGGDLFVSAAAWLAEVSGLPKFLIGATIVSAATTLPELLVSLMAAAEGRTGIAVGNAVGSVTANLGLILGFSAAWLPAVLEKGQDVTLTIMLASIALLIAGCVGGTLSQPGAWALILLFAAFMAFNLKNARAHLGADRGGVSPTPRLLLVNGGEFLLGAAGIVAGARLMVDNGCALARWMGVPEGVIGATLIAVGTSLPELITALTALVKRQAALSIGNIVGANILDLTVILPLCALLSGAPLPLLAQNLALDLPFCLLLCAVAALPALFFGRFRRAQGVALLAGYGVYVGLLCLRFT